ncbi:MAG: HNH endonuclease [Bacillota bacterium]|nr:HNH endonuclease [Bacillota bacterium]
MPENFYIYKKEVDWSLLHQGLSIPLDIQVVFNNAIKRFIRRGESKEISLVLEGMTYKAVLVNQAFEETKYPTHKDILQIRYNPQSEIAVKIRSYFVASYRYLSEQREQLNKKRKIRVDIPMEKKEYLALYTTEYEDTYLMECITADENVTANNIFVKESEQDYEIALNYNIEDPHASIQTVQQLTKIRKLNRAISENLKMLYDYHCQICGANFGKRYGVNIVESHHLDPFVVSLNNDSSNQIILCPNHHRVFHRANPRLDKKRTIFVYPNGIEEQIRLNKHLF